MTIRTRFSLAMLAALVVAADKKAHLPDNRTIDSFEYAFAAAPCGPSANFSVIRSGKVRYTYAKHPTMAQGSEDSGIVVQKEWEIDAKEAKALLQGIVDDGLLDLEDTLGGKFPNHWFRISYGRWQLVSHPKTMSGPIMKRLRPYLQKAHPELWKDKK
jgi:hypothetical protein